MGVADALNLKSFTLMSRCHCSPRVLLVSFSIDKRPSYCNSCLQSGPKHMQGYEQHSGGLCEGLAQVGAVQNGRGAKVSSV